MPTLLQPKSDSGRGPVVNNTSAKTKIVFASRTTSAALYKSLWLLSIIIKSCLIAAFLFIGLGSLLHREGLGFFPDLSPTSKVTLFMSVMLMFNPRMHLCCIDGLIYLSFLIPQGIASDVVRYFAFFSYFAIQLAQLFLCCFADQPPEGKTVLEKVSQTVSWVFAVLWFSGRFSLLEGLVWFSLLLSLPLPRHRVWLRMRGVWMCVFLILTPLCQNWRTSRAIL